MKQYGTYIDWDEGWHHESELLDLDECREELEKVFRAVFITGDVDAMVSALEDLGGLMDYHPDFVTPDFKITGVEPQPLLEVVNG